MKILDAINSPDDTSILWFYSSEYVEAKKPIEVIKLLQAEGAEVSYFYAPNLSKNWLNWEVYNSMAGGPPDVIFIHRIDAVKNIDVANRIIDLAIFRRFGNLSLPKKCKIVLAYEGEPFSFKYEPWFEVITGIK